jgi:hypothetical protein
MPGELISPRVTTVLKVALIAWNTRSTLLDKTGRLRYHF